MRPVIGAAPRGGRLAAGHREEAGPEAWFRGTGVVKRRLDLALASGRRVEKVDIHGINGALSYLVQTVLGGFALVLAAMVGLLAVDGHPTRERTDWRAGLDGAAFGLVSALATLLPTHGLYTGLCAVPLLLAAPTFGLGAGLVAAVTACVGEVLLSPTWSAWPLWHVAVPAAVGWGAAWLMGWRGVVSIRKSADFRLLHVVMLVVVSPLAALASDALWWSRAASLMSHGPDLMEYVLLIQVATAITGLIASIRSAHARSERRLRDLDAQLRNIAGNIPGVIYRRGLGPRGEPILHYLSDRCEAVFGVPAKRLIANPSELMALVHPDDVGYLRGVQKTALDIGAEPLVAEFRIVRPDGQVRWIQSRSQVNRAASAILGESIGDGIAFDVTEQREGLEAQRRLAWIAEHDPLTGCLNRAAFELRLEQRPAAPSAHDEFVVFLNLRDSRRLNELFGEAAGDRRIAEAARRLKAAAPDAIIARLGGDEFALYGTVPEGGGPPVDALRGALGQPYLIRSLPVPIRADFGSVLASVCGSGVGALLRSAGGALSEARLAKTPAVIDFTLEFDKERNERKELDAAIAAALAASAFDLSWQPIVCAADRRIVGHEALTRWRHGDDRWLAPSIFVPRIEALGLWAAFDEWVLRTACLEAMRRPDSGWVAVNLSAGWFLLGNLVPMVERVLAETGLPAGRLYLEITERVLIEDFAAAREVICALHAIGVCVAIDDFGSTYSSLSYIYALPVDKVKIDKAFIDDLATDARLQAIVRSLITLFRELGIECVAEGVEAAAQLDLLAQFGCSLIQGYLTGRPQLVHLSRPLSQACPTPS